MSIENQKQSKIEQEANLGAEYATSVTVLEDTVKQKIVSLYESPEVPVVVGYTDDSNVERLLHLDGRTDAPKYGEPVSTTVITTVNPDLDKPDWSTIEISKGIAKRVAVDPVNPTIKNFKKMTQDEVEQVTAQIAVARAIRGRELEALDVKPINSFDMPEADDLARAGNPEAKKSLADRLRAFGKTATYHAENAHDKAMSDRPFPRKFE